jgi:hypothetical protein
MGMGIGMGMGMGIYISDISDIQKGLKCAVTVVPALKV